MMCRPWLAALVLGSTATPAAVILAVPAPRPLDVILAWPLVLMDIWVGSESTGGAEVPPEVRIAALALGIALTWVHYVVLARLVLWRVADRGRGGE